MDHTRRQQLDRFHASRQEPVRLDIALEEFLRPGLDADAEAEYAAYLQRRLRPAVAALIHREDLTGLEALRSRGWLDARQIDDGIAHARKEKRTAALIWLLAAKDRDFGWPDRDFTL